MSSVHDSYKSNVLEAVSFLKNKIQRRPDVILVLGTGLGGLGDQIKADHVIEYKSIPHFPSSTVVSHTGNLIFGTLGGKYVAALQGRFHYYEGYSSRQVAFPVRVLSLLGPKILFVSNASGGLNPEYSPGTVMIIKDHLNFIPDNPLRGSNEEKWGPRFPDCSCVYDPELIKTVQSSAKKIGLENIEKGIPTSERTGPERKPFTSKEITVQFSLKKLLFPALIFVAVVVIGLILSLLV